MTMHRRLSALYFFYFAYIGAFAPYFTLYLQSLGFSAWDIGLLMSMAPLMRLLAPTFWGALSDRSGRRVPIIQVSSVLAACAFLVFFATTSFAGVLFGIALTFFFWTGAHPLVEALTLHHLHGRAEEYGHIRLWGSVGFVIAVVAVGAALDVVRLESLLWMCLAMLAGIVLCTLRLHEATAAPGDHAPVSLGEGLRRWPVIALMVACLFMSAAHAPFYVFFSIHLVDHGYGKTLIGVLWSLGVVAEILVFLYMPRLMNRYSLRVILLASFMLAAIRFLMIGWWAASLPLVVIAQLMHAATFGANHAAAVTALNRWFPAHQQGRVQAIYGSISFGAGSMLGNLVSGTTWSTLGAGWTYTLGATAALIGWALVHQGIPARDPAPPAPQ